MNIRNKRWLSVFTLASALVVLVLSASALAGPGKGGFKTKDLPAKAEFSDETVYAVTSDGRYGSVYISGEARVSCFIGRREGQFSLKTSNKATSGRTLHLDDLDQIDESTPESCGNFSGNRVSEMRTARVGDEYGGVDLRYLVDGDEVVVPLWLNVYDDRQNLWHVRYDGVCVEPVAFEDGDPTAWLIDTDCTDTDRSKADVSRIVNNQYANPIPCGQFFLPFHLRVDLQ